MADNQAIASALIRPARVGDLEAINHIYNHYVGASTATFAETALTLPQRQAWWRRHEGRFPVLAAESGSGALLGWACASEYRPREGYRFTVEDSVYLRHDLLGQGLGTRLLAALVAEAGRRGFRTMLAFISADQAQSIAVHRKAGFAEVGRMGRVGFKFGRWLDVVVLQKGLSAEAAAGGVASGTPPAG